MGDEPGDRAALLDRRSAEASRPRREATNRTGGAHAERDRDTRTAGDVDLVAEARAEPRDAREACQVREARDAREAADAREATEVTAA